MEDQNICLGRNLKRFRQLYGISQSELGDKLGLTRETIYRYENDSQNPPLQTLIRISKLFGMSLDCLVGVDDRDFIEVTHLSDKQKKALRAFLEVYPYDKNCPL